MIHPRLSLLLLLFFTVLCGQSARTVVATDIDFPSLFSRGTQRLCGRGSNQDDDNDNDDDDDDQTGCGNFVGTGYCLGTDVVTLPMCLSNLEYRFSLESCQQVGSDNTAAIGVGYFKDTQRCVLFFSGNTNLWQVCNLSVFGALIDVGSTSTSVSASGGDPEVTCYRCVR